MTASLWASLAILSVADGASPYYKADGGVNCPVEDRIFDEEECQIAGDAVGHAFNKVVSQADRPAGCFWDKGGGCYLNTNEDASTTWGGVGGLCKHASPAPAPTPVPKPSPSSKNTKVFFLLGQSNMEGQGIVKISDGSGQGNGTLEYAVKHRPSQGLPVYDFDEMASRREACNPKDVNLDDLVKSDGSWQTWPNVQVDYFGKTGSNWGMVHPRGDLSVGFGVNSQRGVGPELGFGVEMAKHYGEDSNVLLVKVAWGGTALAVDWRPPSSVATYGGEVGWCYTNFTTHAHEVLEGLSSYEIAGLVWHQGWNDGCSSDQVAEYERNLANLISDVRAEFGVPDLKVSIPVSGLDAWRGTVDRRLGVIRAQYAVTQYPENQGTVGAQETRGFVRFFDESNGACNQGYHFNCNGESYYYIGSVAGQSMAALLDGTWTQPVIHTDVVLGDVQESVIV